MQIWSEISYEDNLNSMEHFQSMSLWHNSLIRIENRPVYYKEWYVKGITKVSHLMKDANTFLSFYEFNERYNIKANFLSFSGMVSSLKSLRERCKVSVHIKDSNYQSFIETSLKAKKPNRVVYKKLITVKQQRPAQSQDKWVLDCQLKTCEDVDWKSVYQTPFKYIKVTKLITFQFKPFHRRLATNDFLKKIGLKQSDICTFFETEIESIIHLFCSCRVTSSFWRDFRGWIKDNLDNTSILDKINLDAAIALGLRPSVFHKQMYLYFLLARYFIWICKTQGKAPKLKNFLCFSTLFL